MTKKSSALEINVRPLADRVLIEKLPPPPIPEMESAEKVIGGIVVKQPVRPKVVEGDGYCVVRVLDTGPDCKMVTAGDRIMLARHHAFYAKEEDAEGTFIKESDIIAIVE